MLSSSSHAACFPWPQVEIHAVHRQRVPYTPEAVEYINKLSELRVVARAIFASPALVLPLHSRLLFDWSPLFAAADHGCLLPSQAHSLVDLLDAGPAAGPGLDKREHDEWEEMEEEWEVADSADGVVSSCTVTHANSRVSCEMRPLLISAPPVMRPDGQAWPPPPSAIVATPEALNQWLQLAVEVKKKGVEEETEHEHQTFLFAGASLASHMSIRQQLSNLPLAVKMQARAPSSERES